jgi:hypothetical protein
VLLQQSSAENSKYINVYKITGMKIADVDIEEDNISEVKRIRGFNVFNGQKNIYYERMAYHEK